MKVSTKWLKELVPGLDIDKVVEALPHKTIGTKEVTSDFIELDMKGYNRADLLSMRGVAYEVAAITDLKAQIQETSEKDFVWNEKELPKVSLTIEDIDLSPVFCLAKIEGLKVEKSSQEVIDRLASAGMRSVNNIADITNLIMLEFGQPQHAFDADKIQDESIIVRRAKNGEKLKTLDEKTRELNSDDLVIADPSGPVGLAGVMGGKSSEVSDETTTILLESAIFDSRHLRRTSTRFNLHSEASKRFQHGLTPKRLLQALDAAIRMYTSLGGKLTSLSITGDFNKPERSIILRMSKVKALIGLELSKLEVEDILKKLNFTLSNVDEDTFEVNPPYYRLDVTLEEDIIEEVARMYGYDKIKIKDLEGDLPEKIDQSSFGYIHFIKQKLKEAGFSELQTYSFYSTKVLGALGWSDESKKSLVRVGNPISTETEYLRMDLWPNLLEALDKNLRQGLKDAAIFEIGKVYLQNKEGVPNEPYRLSMVLTNDSDNPIPEMVALLKKILPDLRVEQGSVPESVSWLFHPKRFLNVLNKEDKMVAGIAEIHPKVLDKFGISQRVAVFEINL